MIQRETKLIVKPFVEFMKTRDWHYENIHGNQFQRGLPDGYFSHPDYSPRWIEFKVIDNMSIKLTDAQRKKFPILIRNNVPIYVVASYDLRGGRGKAFDEELCKKYYRLVIGEPNAYLALNKRLHKQLFIL